MAGTMRRLVQSAGAASSRPNSQRIATFCRSVAQGHPVAYAGLPVSMQKNSGSATPSEEEVGVGLAQEPVSCGALGQRECRAFLCGLDQSSVGNWMFSAGQAAHSLNFNCDPRVAG